MANENDSVLTDYFSELLTPTGGHSIDEGLTLSLDSQACLQVKIGGQDLLLPLADLSGMQAICGPLISVGGIHWKGEKHSVHMLLDLRQPLSILEVPYEQSSWQGHSLKLKQTEQSILVDLIVGPVHSKGDEKWLNFNGVRYTLVIV